MGVISSHIVQSADAIGFGPTSTLRLPRPSFASSFDCCLPPFQEWDAKRRGFVLRGLNEQILENVINPAEVEDIVVLCETTALYRKRSKQTPDLVFTKEILDLAMARVVVG
jgi:hypothetical protein